MLKEMNVYTYYHDITHQSLICTTVGYYNSIVSELVWVE